MRKREGRMLEGVTNADLERVIGGMKIGSLSASDWMITSAIGSPSASGSGSTSSSGAPRGRHDGFIGVLGFLPTRDFSDGAGANPDDVGLPPSEPSPEAPPPEDVGGCDGDGGGDIGSLVCGGLDGLDGLGGLDGLDGLDGLGGCDGGMDPDADTDPSTDADGDMNPDGGMAQVDITVDPVDGGSLHYLY